jgi:hypothetical protein
MSEDRLAEIRARLALYDAREGPDFCECCMAMSDVKWLLAEIERLRPLARLGAAVEAMPPGSTLDHLDEGDDAGWPGPVWQFSKWGGHAYAVKDTPGEALGLAKAQP